MRAPPAFKPFSGTIWRILWADQPDQALKAARAPEGRFHHDGQRALYASLSAEGAGVALGYYLRPDDAARSMVQLQLHSDQLVDLTDPKDACRLGFEISDTTWRWQNDCKAGNAPRTWTVSDYLRAMDAHGLVFRSSQKTNLHHIVLFQWNTNVKTSLRVVDKPRPWAPLDH